VNKVIIVGRPNVGKSTLFNRLVGKRLSIVHDMPGITRDALEAIAHWKDKSFLVVDTGGLLEDKDHITQEIRKKVQELLNQASVILFVVDGKEGITHSDRAVAELLYPHREKVLLVVNKMDVKSAKENLYDFYSLGFERVYPISAQHGKGVGELLDDVVSMLPEEEVVQREGLRLSFVGRPNVGSPLW